MKLVHCFTSIIINKLLVLWFSIMNKVPGVSVSPRAKKVTFSILKGHCHGIWQLYKKLEGVFESIEFQN